MDKTLKFLTKLTNEQRNGLLILINKILSGRGANCCGDLISKKLKGFGDLYRVKYGKIRIIYRKTASYNVIIGIGFRGDVYKNL